MTTQTATGIITMAYKDSGKLARGGVLSADMLAEGIDRLNDLINLWQTKGLKLWLETETTIPLVAGQQMYSLRPGGDAPMTRPLRVKEAAYRSAQSNTYSLVPLSRQEWTDLASRSQTGSISQYFAEKLADRLNLHFWNTPDTTAALGTVRAVLHNQAGNVVAGADSPNFPIEWTLALRWGLADDLATGMPEAVVQRCAQKAAVYIDALEEWDVEDAEVKFQPNLQGYGNVRSFR